MVDGKVEGDAMGLALGTGVGGVIGLALGAGVGGVIGLALGAGVRGVTGWALGSGVGGVIGLALGAGVGGVIGLVDGLPDRAFGLLVGTCVGGMYLDPTVAASVYVAQLLTPHMFDP